MCRDARREIPCRAIRRACRPRQGRSCRPDCRGAAGRCGSGNMALNDVTAHLGGVAGSWPGRNAQAGLELGHGRGVDEHRRETAARGGAPGPGGAASAVRVLVHRYGSGFRAAALQALDSPPASATCPKAPAPPVRLRQEQTASRYLVDLPLERELVEAVDDDSAAETGLDGNRGRGDAEEPPISSRQQNVRGRSDVRAIGCAGARSRRSRARRQARRAGSRSGGAGRVSSRRALPSPGSYHAPSVPHDRMRSGALCPS